MTYKLYNILGLNKNDNPSLHEIKKAYKKKAMEYHPDKNRDNPQEAEEKFKEVTHAYEVLSDETKKRRYDHEGDDRYKESDTGGHPMNHADIFEQFFAGSNPFGGHPFNGGPFGSHFGFNFGHQNGEEQCNNVHKEFHITLEEAFNGINKNIQIHVTKYCHNCMNKCKNCSGTGIVKQVKHMGVFTQVFTGKCDHCMGSGYATVSNKACSECQGKGTFTKTINANLSLPKGINDGFKTVFEDMGEQPKTPKQKAGDLILEIKISEHKLFKRSNNDLIYNCDISYIDSVIGKEITIPYFKESLTINTNTFGVVYPGKQYVIDGKGMPVLNSSKMGSMIIEFNIKYPKIKNKDKIEELTRLMQDVFYS